MIIFDNINRNLIVKIIGDIDHHSSKDIREKIDKEINKHKIKNIIFDFSEVIFMDSSGIGMVIGRYKNIEKAGGKVAISSISDEAKRIFELSGLFRIINLYDNIDSALKGFG